MGCYLLSPNFCGLLYYLGGRWGGGGCKKYCCWREIENKYSLALRLVCSYSGWNETVHVLFSREKKTWRELIFRLLRLIPNSLNLRENISFHILLYFQLDRIDIFISHFSGILKRKLAFFVQVPLAFYIWPILCLFQFLTDSWGVYIL